MQAGKKGAPTMESDMEAEIIRFRAMQLLHSDDDLPPVGVPPGNGEPTTNQEQMAAQYQQLEDQLMNMNRYLTLLTKGCEILMPFNPGREGRALHVRYNKNTVNQRDWRPLLNVVEKYGMQLPAFHVSQYDVYFETVSNLVQSTYVLINSLRDSQNLFSTPISNPEMRRAVAFAARRLTTNQGDYRMAVALMNKYIDDFELPGNYDSPAQLGEDGGRKLWVCKTLQTTFVESLTAHLTGAFFRMRDIEPMIQNTRPRERAPGDKCFSFCEGGMRFTFVGHEAYLARFERNGRRYWSPASNNMAREGIVVFNTEMLFKCPLLTQYVRANKMPTMEGELAGRTLFEVMHYPMSLRREYPGEEQGGYQTDKGYGYYYIMPSMQDTVNELLKNRYLHKRPRNLFPAMYEQSATQIYHVLLQRITISPRPYRMIDQNYYLGLFRVDMNLAFDFVVNDLSPIKEAGSLAGAKREFEGEFEQDDEETQPNAGGSQPNDEDSD